MLTPPPPPAPRKKPQQLRSQRMVEAITESCKKILVEYGEEALTLPLLESVSGVGKGSIYQYFPNLDAVIAAVYECECQRHLKNSAALVIADGISDLTFQTFLQKLITRSADSHRELEKLHSSFYRHYCTHFDIHQMYGEQIGITSFIEDYIVPLIIKEKPEIAHHDGIEIGIMVLESIRSQFFAALQHYPERIFQSPFQQHLINIGLYTLHTMTEVQNLCDAENTAISRAVQSVE